MAVDEGEQRRKGKRKAFLTASRIMFILVLLIGLVLGIFIGTEYAYPFLKGDIYKSLQQTQTDNELLNEDLEQCIRIRDQLQKQVILCDDGR